MIEFYKKRGETPLEALERLRFEQPELKNEILSYAGRLDPMAEGILCILVGREENQKRESFLRRDKEYYAEFILGYSTDTGDVLGLLTSTTIIPIKKELIEKKCLELIKIKEQVYPWYSSKTVNGRPLFEYAQKKDFSIERPSHSVLIYEVFDIVCQLKNNQDLLNKISEDIKKVTGNFRQEQILEAWKKQHTDVDIQIVSFKIKVSSGTYIRSLAEILSQELSVPVVLYKLVRTKIF